MPINVYIRQIISIIMIWACWGFSHAWADCTSIKNGSWSAASTWNCGRTPNGTDNVTVNNSVDFDLSVSTTIKTMTLNGSGITGSGSGPLILTGDLNNNSKLNTPNLNVTVNGNVNNNGSLFSVNQLIASKTITNNGSFLANTVTVVKDLNNNSAAFTVGTLTFAGIGNQSPTIWGNNTTVNRLVVSSGVTLTNTSYSFLNVTGDIVNNGSINLPYTTWFINGNSTQNIIGNNITIGFLKLNNSFGLNLSQNVTVQNDLTLTNGNILTNNFLLSLPKRCSDGSISGGNINSFVDGRLQLNYPAWGTSCTYPVGNAGGYAPVTITFPWFSGIVGGTLTVNTVAAEHPAIGTSEINAHRDVTRYWSVGDGADSMGILPVWGSYSITMQFPASDVDADANINAFQVSQYTETWSPLAGTVNGKTATLSGVNRFGSFAVGEKGTNAVPPAAFNCVEVGADASTGHLYTKLAGAPFTVDVVALNVSQGIETTFAAEQDAAVTVELGYASDAACTDWVALSPAVSQNVLFSAANKGRKTSAAFTVNQAAPNLRCRITDANQTPVRSVCSTDNFAVRPSNFVLSAPSANADSTGVSSTASPKIAAGSTFTLNAAALAGYTGVPRLDSTKLSVSAAAVRAGTLTGTFVAGDALTGVAAGSVQYDETGYFKLDAGAVIDDSFTAVDAAVGDCTADSSSNMVGGKYGCSIINTAVTPYFGRFIPDHFAVIAAPITHGCSTFTYFGQDFGTRFQLVPQTLANVTTQNYVGGSINTWNFSVSGAASGAALSSDIPVVTWAGPIATVVTQHRLTRPTAISTPSSITMRARPMDVDGVTLRAITNISSATAQMRFGRARLLNTQGSEQLDLPVYFQVEYLQSNTVGATYGWQPAKDDTCSIISSLNITPVTGFNSSACLMDDLNKANSNNACPPATLAARQFQEPPLSGSFNVWLKAPQIKTSLDIGADVPKWLQFNWGSGAAICTAGTAPYNKCPTARVSFGLQKSGKVVYMQESY
jgi:hypothetical protein